MVVVVVIVIVIMIVVVVVVGRLRGDLVRWVSWVDSYRRYLGYGSFVYRSGRLFVDDKIPFTQFCLLAGRCVWQGDF